MKKPKYSYFKSKSVCTNVSSLVPDGNYFEFDGAWGEVQACETLCRGIYLVTTPGHGGILVEHESTFYLSAAARKCGFRDGGYLCFEEDCDEQIVLRELLDKKLWRIPSRITDPEGLEKDINESLQQYHPDYWTARAKALRRSKTPKKQPPSPTR